jgi:hypothetical protein
MKPRYAHQACHFGIVRGRNRLFRPPDQDTLFMYAFSAALLRIYETPRPVYGVPNVTAALESNESSSKAQSLGDAR